MSRLGDFFRPNIWKEHDPDWSFRNKVMDILGTWQFSKLEALMDSGKMFEHDFFSSGKFTGTPDEDKMEAFSEFVRSWGKFLEKSGTPENAVFVLEMADRLFARIPKADFDSLPQWFTMLPFHLQPPKEKVAPLENLRKQRRISHVPFMIGIGTSPWAVVHTQEYTLGKLRRQFNDYSERDLWRAVIFSRLEAKLRNPTPDEPSMEELLRRIGSMESIMQNIHSWDDVIKYVLKMDENVFARNPTGYQHEINEVLST